MMASWKTQGISNATERHYAELYWGLLNLIWWYVFGYGLGDKPVEEYKYILGLPSWFFLSCVLGSVVFIVLTFVMVDKMFKHMPLHRFTEEEQRNI